jgi:hypothetical protein
VTDGVGEVCAYCGVQNVIRSEVWESARSANENARQIALTLAYARRELREGLWGRIGASVLGPLWVYVIVFALMAY